MFTPEELALELGGTIKRADGTVFNSAGRSGVYRLPKRAEPPPQDPMAAVLEKMTELLARPAPAPEIPAPVVHVQPAAPAAKPILAWAFTFERNADGTIKTIRARATKD